MHPDSRYRYRYGFSSCIVGTRTNKYCVTGYRYCNDNISRTFALMLTVLNTLVTGTYHRTICDKYGTVGFGTNDVGTQIVDASEWYPVPRL
jgi:hypothetical protein